ncbi:uncharacterized protein LOC110445635 isoform X2 [Mizuhopecten yessoensis]|uniref:uncharacterized protein LOC110445635 isoform X2 n=1 Tax=Mizuhopecten yessoensis TaxID=6573 RepID=UPI000B45E977|nr:uncharacterized protein LOC110445635 isoform X2 [Mizuhopecten yessoensis]
MPTSPKPSKIFFSKVSPLPAHQTDVEDSITQQRCPVELFLAKRGFQQSKLNFLTSVVETYDADLEFGWQSSQRQSLTLKNETNNNGSPKDVESDKDLDSASTSNSGSGISMVGKKGKIKAFRKALRRLVNKSNIVQPKHYL